MEEATTNLSHDAKLMQQFPGAFSGLLRSKMASSYVKRSTALVGLAVSKAPREALTKLYQETLEVLGSMPKSAKYRTHTEQITKQRLGLVEQESDIPKLENKLGAGQIEEVIKQAEDELSLAKKMQEWQPWEPLQNPPPADQWKWP